MGGDSGKCVMGVIKNGNDRINSKLASSKPGSCRITHSPNVVGFFRAITLAVIAIIYFKYDLIQHHMDTLWQYLLRIWVFNSAYFETLWVTVVYSVLVIIPCQMNRVRWFDRYKVHKDAGYKPVSIGFMLKELPIYWLPLMALDTIYIKKYSGVSPEIWAEQRKSWIQTYRALPESTPSIWELTYQLVGSILLYDALFFFIHYAVHKNAFLYKYVHATHHDHDTVHSHVTNKLSVIERLILVLTANGPLKIMNAHPLTRTLFVPVFVWLLLENHSGYDLPCGLQHLIPFGIVGGPAKHFDHHTYGSQNYQPFLTYLDRVLELRKKIKR